MGLTESLSCVIYVRSVTAAVDRSIVVGVIVESFVLWRARGVWEVGPKGS